MMGSPGFFEKLSADLAMVSFGVPSLTETGGLVKVPALVEALAVFEYVPTTVDVLTLKIRVAFPLTGMDAAGENVQVRLDAPTAGEVVGANVPPPGLAKVKPVGRVSLMLETVSGLVLEVL